MQLRTPVKLLSGAVAALLACSLVSCGSPAAENASASSAASGTETAQSAASAPKEAEGIKAPAPDQAETEAAEGTQKAAAKNTAGDAAENAAEEKTSGPAEGSGEVIVFAAASMTETLTEIAEMYREAVPGVELTFNFDSSGTLVTQIEEGAECDLFISAAQKQMNEIDGSRGTDVNPDGLDLIDPGSRTDILENKVTLVVPEDDPKEIESFDDLSEHLEAGDILMAMGNEDVPVGQYTQKILDYYGLDEAALAEAGCITYGSNVKEVATQVAEASVDCGVIYCTDAFSAGLKIVDEAVPEMCGQVIYPAAVLRDAPNAAAAQAFLDYLQTDECMAVFEAVGFSAVD